MYYSRPTLSVVCLWAVTRVIATLAGLSVLPYPGRQYLFTDLDTYSDWLPILSNGHFPVGDAMWQYPPMAGPVFVLAQWLATSISLPSAYWGFLVLFLAVDALIMACLIGDARSRRRWTGALLWAAAALLVGPVMLGRFDVVPTLFAVIALLLLARPAAFGAATAVGALLKVWPVLTLAAVPRRDLPKAIGWTAVFGLLGLALVSFAMDDPLSFLDEQASRGLQVESVGALPYLLAKAVGMDITFVFRYGAMEVDAPGTGLAALIATSTCLVALGAMALWRLRGRLESVPGADVVFAVMLVAIATSRVNSPQYLVWLFGVGAVCLADPRSRMHVPVLLIAVSAPITAIVFPWGYGAMLGGGVFPVLLQAVRILLLVAATVYAVDKILRPEADVRTSDQLVRRRRSEAESDRVRVAALE